MHIKTNVLVNSACKKHGKNIAIVNGYSSITYQELFLQISSTVELLEKIGISHGDVIEIIGKKSTSIIISILSSWQVGATVFLTNKGMEDRLEKIINPSVRIYCDTGIKITKNNINFHTLHKRQSLKNNDNAYIVLTSGSTGNPKIIVGSHTSLSHFLQWQKKKFSISSNNRFSNFTNVEFDVFFRDVFISLITGATLYIPQEDVISPDYMFDFIKHNKITGINVVPSIANLWVSNSSNVNTINSLKYSFFAGEMLTFNLVKKWTSIFTKTKVINLYGPSETTLAKSFNIIKLDQYLTNKNYSVGKNIEGSRVILINKNNKICKHGEVGEIYIKTKYTSNGYLLEKGIKTHLSPLHIKNKTYKAFRTGDLGVINNGELEIVGRTDSQIKINGVRIELLAIKNIIDSIAKVKESFVLPITSNEKIIIVLIVNSDIKDKYLYINTLKNNHIPDISIPSKIYFMQGIPKNLNGKIDRKFITNYVLEDINKTHMTLSSAIEHKIKNIWSELLGMKNIPEKLNFFDAGGNSLLITILCQKINKEFGVDLLVTDLFSHTTIELQSLYLKKINNSNNLLVAKIKDDNIASDKRKNFIKSMKRI